MQITWIGQAGLLFNIQGFQLMIDPYLSDSVGEQMGNHRRVPVASKFLQIELDALICTHNHLDHQDPETIHALLGQGQEIQVLAPWEAWREVRKSGGNHNYILFNQNTEVTLNRGVRVKAVRAEHSDPSAIGVLLQAENKTLYITGDTLYNKGIFEDLPTDIDAVFLPINGVGNNMNLTDAARFAERTGAKTVIPIHWGMLDTVDPAAFKCPNRIIPELYKEIVF